jgi:hypothetical protein
MRHRDGPELRHLLPLGGVIIFAAIGMVVELLHKIHGGDPEYQNVISFIT